MLQRQPWRAALDQGPVVALQMRSLDELASPSERSARIVGGTCEMDLRVVADAEGK